MVDAESYASSFQQEEAVLSLVKSLHVLEKERLRARGCCRGISIGQHLKDNSLAVEDMEGHETETK